MTSRTPPPRGPYGSYPPESDAPITEPKKTQMHFGGVPGRVGSAPPPIVPKISSMPPFQSTPPVPPFQPPQNLYAPPPGAQVMSTATQRLESAVPPARALVPASLPETPLNVWSSELPKEPDSSLVMLADPDSMRAASYRSLRHRLSASGDPRTVCITSANPKEGKTTCAVNIALALSEGARARVLLVEANFRTPQIARLFGFKPPECFAEQLVTHRLNPLAPWTVVELVGQRLHVLAVDPTTVKRPMLDSVAFSSAMHRLWLAGYDYMIIDTPPVLGSADVNLVVDSVDGILFTAWATKSSRRALRQAMEQLAPANILGVALLDA